MQPSLGVLLFADFSLTELARLGRCCEDLGYRSLWYTDIRFGRECYLGLSAVASATSRILLGPGVTDPYTRHPAITAASIATLDELSAGRAVLGLGAGGQGFGELGIERRLPVAALRETVEIVRALLRGERVEYEGKVVSLDNGRLTFEPVRSEIPIYFATHGAQISRLAGKVADGVLIANTLLPRMLQFYMDRIAEGLRGAGREQQGFNFGLRIEACISGDYDAAFAVMRRRMANRLIGQYPHWEYLKELGVAMPPAFVEIAAKKDARLTDEGGLGHAAGAGRPHGACRRCAACGRATGAGDASRDRQPHHSPPCRPGEPLDEVIRAFAEDVMPRVERLTARTLKT